MKNYYLAIDIGASSGRHILAWMEDEKIHLEEIYRFENGMISRDGQLCWDLQRLFQEILKGLIKCKQLGKIPLSVGIDTWAVDFVLLDKNNEIIGNPIGYRDNRTMGMDLKVYEKIKENALYARTGIQKQIFNTIYQLMAVKEKFPEHLKKAETMLMIPDYFHFLLTGKKMTEYTNATTTQLVRPDTKNWDTELINILGYPQEIFMPITLPGTVLGELTEEISDKIGFTTKVVLPATHDTASAVMAAPYIGEDTLYLSSGTWSLMGIENNEANCFDKSRVYNFTNEGGYEYKYRFLKNIMGLWMIQSVKKELDNIYSFPQLSDMAEKEDIISVVNCNDQCFMSPKNMIKEIQNYCKKTGQRVPESPGEIARVIFNSLTNSYLEGVEELEEITNRKYKAINIIGGGSNAEYLNRLISNITGRTVFAGPTEATAIGNVLAQMIAVNELESLEDARKCVAKSFDIKKIVNGGYVNEG